jgi:hypothetical protein
MPRWMDARSACDDALRGQHAGVRQAAGMSACHRRLSKKTLAV